MIHLSIHYQSLTTLSAVLRERDREQTQRNIETSNPIPCRSKRGLREKCNEDDQKRHERAGLRKEFAVELHRRGAFLALLDACIQNS